MFKKFLKKKDDATETQRHPADEAMEFQMQSREKEDPLIRAKMASLEIENRIIKAMTNEQGVHTESLLTAVAALGGFSCQMPIRKALEDAGIKESFHGTDLMELGAKDGRKFYAGNGINAPLMESKYSLYSLVAGTVNHLGYNNFPDIHEIAGHYASSIGSDDFGIPRVPEGSFPAGDTPLNYLKAIWPHLQPVLIGICPDPTLWPIAFGLALQKIVEMTKDVVNPEIAFQTIMEVAILSAKYDPKEIAQPM